MGVPTIRCAAHPQERAGWRCGRCGAALCPDCVVPVRYGPVTVTQCGRCGGDAPEQLKVHRSAIPYRTRVLQAWRYPLSRSGLLTLGGLGVALAFSAYFCLAPLVLCVLSVFGYIFHCLRRTSIGDDEIGPPDFTQASTDLYLPALKGLLATALVWAPPLVYLVQRASPPAWVSIAWLVAGALYAPMGLMMAAAGAPILRMVNPVAVVGSAVKLGLDYLLAAVGLVAAFVLGVVLEWGASLLPFGLLASIVANSLALYGPLVIARVLGLLLFVHGDKVGLGVPSDYFEPVLPGVEPRGAALPGRGAVAPSKEAQPQAAPALAGTLLEIALAVDARDVDRALSLYGPLTPERVAPLAPAHHLTIGQAAATKGDYELAVRALKAAAELAPEDPIAPKAWIILARVHGERLGDTMKANELYGYVARRYPGTDAAKFAASKLTEI